jgi:hypothetical protein
MFSFVFFSEFIAITYSEYNPKRNENNTVELKIFIFLFPRNHLNDISPVNKRATIRNDTMLLPQKKRIIRKEGITDITVVFSFTSPVFLNTLRMINRGTNNKRKTDTYPIILNALIFNTL